MTAAPGRTAPAGVADHAADLTGVHLGDAPPTPGRRRAPRSDTPSRRPAASDGLFDPTRASWRTDDWPAPYHRQRAAATVGDARGVLSFRRFRIPREPTRCRHPPRFPRPRPLRRWPSGLARRRAFAPGTGPVAAAGHQLHGPAPRRRPVHRPGRHDRLSRERRRRPGHRQPVPEHRAIALAGLQAAHAAAASRC